MTDLRALWDFDDPAGSEQRFREAADVAEGTERLVLLTQVARALGLQEKYDDGHAILDHLAVGDHEVAARVSLERGRLLRSAGSPDAARPHFDAAAAYDEDDALRIDAIHMQALVAPPEEQVALHERALAIATGSADQEARDWDASLLNNIGMTHADAGDFAAALATFEQAVAARERIGDDDRTRVARWMVGWALRHLGRTAEALAVQQGLKAELDALGATDPHVDAELAELGELGA
ncbi:tetratricopeptide repeat protein [Nocardioides sp. SR21]|uniref:tetratricopeptide repeat protein n=1 Tax=Nocardioides sp. SR21 TaxID=2919501 RepID=UPI001FAA3AAD|nr:tetratricopeptide repeat protein [Nocardioides sp. SR21]